jgi:phosphonopyruvate decarboxylase
MDSLLKEVDVELFTGVPDSCFLPWVNYLSEVRPNSHVTATDEGEALSIAAGYHLATGRIAGVYLQNSGLGNLVNPLTSIIDKYVYKIPTLLMISWRGKPDRKDEPQHRRMGEITTRLLENMDVQYHVYNNETDLKKALNQFKAITQDGGSYAILFTKGDITYRDKTTPSTVIVSDEPKLTRWDAISHITESFAKDATFFSTTGKTSRELYLLRDLTGSDHSLDFLNVGGMGWVSSLALGFALGSGRRIVILDGDGSALMHLGNIATIGHYKPQTLFHFILDNQSHDSIGGLKTVSATVDFPKLAVALGYRRSVAVSTLEDLHRELVSLKNEIGPVLVSVRVRKGARPDLPRPALSPLERKTQLLQRFAG